MKQPAKNNMFLSFIPTKISCEDDSSADRQTPRLGNKSKLSRKSTIVNEPVKRLTLKDYLRLNNITKKSSSNSRSKKEREVSSEKKGSRDKNYDNTVASIELLKDEIKSDLKKCMERLEMVHQKIEKPSKLNSTRQCYEQLVFLCSLHREIKEGALKSLQTSNQMLTFNIHDQISHNFDKKSQTLSEKSQSPTGTSPTRKRSPSIKKKIRNLTGTEMISQSKKKRSERFVDM